MDVDHSELQSIVQRAKDGPLGDDDCAKLMGVVDTLAMVTAELESKTTSLSRLRRMLFGPSTEKTNKVLGKIGSDKDVNSADDDGESTSEHQGVDADPAGPKAKPKRSNHGRNGADDYKGAEKISVQHESLTHGDNGPGCLKGKVYIEKEPALRVRVRGMAPLVATVYELERLRCNLCGEVFTAKAPDGVGNEKDDETATGMMGLLKYGCGVPFNRLERLEGSLGIPLPQILPLGTTFPLRRDPVAAFP